MSKLATSTVLLGGLAILLVKEPTAKVLVTGGDLAGIVEITDAPTLALSNVFSANFLSASRRAAPAPTTAQRYLVSFLLPDVRRNVFARLFERPRLRTSYVVYFNPDDSGYVYVPGAHDAWSVLNHGTIIRDTVEGHWTYANPLWTRAIDARLARAGRRPPPTCPAAPQIPPTDPAFREFAGLRDSLSAHGVHVLCMYHSTFDGAYGSRAGAAMLTDRGPFAALLFPGPASALHISVGVARDQIVTTVRSPYTTRVDSVWDLDPAFMFIHGRWVLDSFGQSPLDSALRASLAP
jgi:hypothetical protein